MKLEKDSYLYAMVRSELADAVGAEYVNAGSADALGHSIDYYWIPEMWHDRGGKPQTPDFVVHPGASDEVAKVLKIANQYRIPVTPWGGGSGSASNASHRPKRISTLDGKIRKPSTTGAYSLKKSAGMSATIVRAHSSARSLCPCIIATNPRKCVLWAM